MSNNNTEKYLQLFNYLLDFAKLREKIIRKVEDYEECIWFSDIPDEERNMCIISDKIDDKERPDWIKISKPKELRFPSLPIELKDWIDEESLWDLNKPPALFESIEQNGSVIRLTEKPKLNELHSDYIENYWIPWSIEEQRYIKKADLYKKFFNIYEKSKKFGEEFELVVGFGLVFFQSENSTYIKRHVLVANATLDFFADKGIFTVGIGAEGAKLRVETEMLQDMELGNISNIHKELEKNIEERELTESPFSKEISNFLESFINRLHPKASYYDTIKFGFETPKYPTLFYSPALILRKRTLKSLSSLYQNIIDLIVANSEVEIPLIDDLIDSSDNSIPNEINIKDSKEELYTDIFFPKVYNDEQIQIIDRLSTRNKILVQGPPGTGKSHTIANLISHLLAHGKTILITAHTKRALTVLKNHLPDEVKPLCVNLLGNDTQSVNDLESSVVNIIRKFDVTTDQEYKAKISELEKSLVQEKKQQKVLEEKLLNLKEFDSRKQTLNYIYTGSWLEIASKIKEEEGKYSWFIDKVINYDKSISMLDLLETVVKRHFIYREIINEFAYILYTGNIMELDELKLLKLCEVNLIDYKNHHSSVLNDDVQNKFKALNKNQISDLENVIIELIDIKKAFDSCKLRWSRKATEECIDGYSNYWIDIYETTSQVLTKKFKDKVEFFEKSHKIEFPMNISKQQINADASIFITHLESGKNIKKFKIFNNKEIKERWYLTTDIIVNGSRCDTLEDYRLLKEHIGIEIEIENLQRIWFDKVDKQDSNYHKYLQIERNKLELEKIIELSIRAKDSQIRISKIIKSAYFSLDENQLRSTLSNIIYYRLMNDYIECKKIKEAFLAELKLFQKKCKAHEVYDEIITAIETENVELYEHCIEKLDSISNAYNDYKIYRNDKSTIRQYFPLLINSLNGNEINLNLFQHDNLKQTIAWSHVKTIMESYLETNAYQDTLDKISEIENDISHTTSELAAERAWYFLFKNMTSKHRKHLVAWFQAIRNIGKGTGKNAWKFRKVAQKQMDECRTAIPAWIMPLYRITETIKPYPGMFDFVIIDEASQAGPDALFLLFIAKKIIIVGDDKQTAPEYLGILKDNVEELLQKHLKDFPFANFYGLESSFYDLAKIFIESGGGKVTLREHFRCMPEIIEFSNKNFYEPFGNSLFPLKQYSEKRLEPIKTTYVSDGFSEGTSAIVYNLTEAKAICNEIENCMKNDLYKDKTIGVISLRGTNQSQRIEKMLLDKFGPEELEKRKLTCGSSANFQGDERDIIFLSMVIDGKKNFRALTTDADKRRFNVAASRAKEQIWLFHSIRLDELSNKEDMRYLMLDYYLNPKSFVFPIINLPKEFDFDKVPPPPFGSWFEVEVYNDLTKLGYHLVPQYPVSKYRIDLGLIFPNGSKIAIECDGDKYHGIEEYQNDIMRQKVLERCGWQFIRIRGCEFYSNRRNTINMVVETLNDLGYEILGSVKQQEEVLYENVSTDNSLRNTEDKKRFFENVINAPIKEEYDKLEENLSKPNVLNIQTDKESQSTEKLSNSNTINSNEKISLNDWFINTDADTWFNFSRIGKERDYLGPMERNFAFNMGKFRKHKWNPSDKQLNFAKKIFDKINSLLKKDEEQEKLGF